MSSNKLSSIELCEYAKLLDEVYITRERISDKAVTELVSNDTDFQDTHESIERNCDGKESVISVIKRLRTKQLQHAELSKRFTIIEIQQLEETLNSLIVRGSDAFLQLQTELSSVNSAVGDCSSLFTLDQSFSLPIQRSAQRAFVDTVSMISKLCNSFDECAESLKDCSNIEWDAVKEIMVDKAANSKDVLSESNSVVKKLSEQFSTLDDKIDNDECDVDSNGVSAYRNL